MIDMTKGSEDRIFFDKYVAYKQKNTPNYFTQEYMQQRLRERIKDLQFKYFRDQKRMYEQYPNEDRTEIDRMLKRIGLSVELQFLADDVLDYAIYSRYEYGKVQDLMNGLYTFGRLHFLGHTVKPDVNVHAYNLQNTAFSAAYDQHILIKLSKEIEKYTPVAYAISPVIIRGIQAIQNGDDKLTRITLSSLKASLKTNDTPWYNAVCGCMIAILTHNNSHFTEFLDNLLAVDIPKRITGALTKYISFPAHALYLLAYRESLKTGLNPPPEPSHKLWDTDFWHYLKSGETRREYIIDVKSVSPVLARWMDELPDSIDLNLLYASA